MTRWRPWGPGRDRGRPAAVGRPRGRGLAAWWLLAAGLAAGTLLHFSLVLAAVAPPGLLPPAARAAASAYVAPIFTQTWWLFAPDPPALERTVDARGLYAEAGRRRATEWLPLTERVVRAVRANRLSSQNAAWIALLYAAQSLTSETILLRVGPEIRERLIGEWAELERQPASLIALERAGSAALAAEHPHLRFEQVQVRLTVRRPRPYGAGEETPEPPAEELLFRPVPFQDVAPWRAGP